MAVPRGPRLLPSTPCTLYGCFAISRGLELSLSKHDFYMQEIVAPVSNRDTSWLLLTFTGKIEAYLL